ncbi:Calcium-binding protein 39 [Trametes pubescens]|uniref:Calcium-binding protein 39 n=1 Tax=Trametes pubescens TaxID=154538 RepID=A0A1M2VHL0_TRAPU|nr:Calcium-binding protein 39 [Trametes pubescens]
MNFFKTKPRTPPDLVRGLRDALPRLEAGPPGGEANDDVGRNLQQIKAILYGDDPLPELVAQLAQETYNTDLLLHLIQNIHKLEFESRKDVVQIFNNLLRRQIGSRFPTVEYLSSKPEVLFAAFDGYGNEEIALNTGMILREMLRHEPLAKILLYSEQFYKFPHYIESTTFGISCDAYTNLKETLTRHKAMVAEYLDKNYDRFFSSFTTLILSNNYVTKRQSLKLLGEILLDRANFNVMTRYIASEANLKMMMNLLRDKSKNIQFEAFHVFKVFVANPKKPPQIEGILRRNKDKLLKFLKDFHNDKEDEQFMDEKQFLIVQIQSL